MKKYRWIFVVSALLIALLGVLCFAAPDASVKLKGPDAVREGDTFTLDFTVSCGDIYGMEATFSESGPITRESIKLNSALAGWTIENQNGVFMAYSNDLAKAFSGENVTLFSITYRLNDDAKVDDLVSVQFSDVILANHLTGEQSNNLSASYKKTVGKKLSTNTNLLNIKIDGKELDGFDYENTAYSLTVPYTTDSLVVSAVCAGEGASYTVSGADSLKVGENSVIVHVTAASGAKKDYTVKVTREEPPVLAYLTGISAGSYSLAPEFDPNTFEYTVTVPYTKSTMTLTPTAAEGVDFTVDGPEKLEIGENLFTISVSDKYDYENTYKVTIIRSQNSNTNLIKLTVEGFTYSPAFDYNVTEYSLTVPSIVSKLEVSAVAAGDGATYAVTGNTLDDKGGKVIVTVTAMDGSTKDYVINVTKQGQTPVNPPAGDETASLNSLSVKGHTLAPAFGAGVKEYTLSVPNSVTSLEISAKGTGNATVTVDGNTDLKVGKNKITVTVKESGKKDGVYTITVTREDKQVAPDGAKLQSITLSTGTLSPAFSADIFSYIVYLPNETKNITVGATAAAGATISGATEYTLLQGSNIITLSIAGADGNATYTITAYVMPAFDGKIPSLNEGNAGTIVDSSSLSVLGSTSVGGKLSATYEGNESGYMIRWFRDGNTVGGSNDYIVTNADCGKTLSVVVYDANGSELLAKEISIPKLSQSLSSKNDGFDVTGMIISLFAALATLVIGFILGRMKSGKHR